MLTLVADCAWIAYKRAYWYLQTYNAIWLYTLRYHIVIFDIDYAGHDRFHELSTVTFCLQTENAII